MNDREYMQPKGEPNIIHSQLPQFIGATEPRARLRGFVW